MLLRPRKTIFKNSRKNRSLKTIKTLIWKNLNNNKKLNYGQFGLISYNPEFLFFNKFLFKIKIFLKKTVRRSKITNRHLWVKVFPHIPVTKKVIGSRMGKGKGKPSNWAAKIPSMSVFIEFKNVRCGRAMYFFKQISYRLPGSFRVISKYNYRYKLSAYRNVNSRYDHFF